MSLRTVYRDLAALGEAGLPIVGEAGVGYSLMRGYHVPPVMFTEDEAAALFLSGEVTERVADESLRSALRSALLKVNAVMPRERREYVTQLQKVIRISSHAAPLQDEDNRALMPLQQAVVRRQHVQISYNARHRGAISERLVEPLGLTYYSRQWHLIAFCRLRQDFRDFRLDRIVEWQVLPECFQGHADFSLKTFLECVMEGLESMPVTIVVKREVLERLRYEMPGTPIQEIELPDGRVRVEMLAFSLEWTANWLMSFSLSMEVESPAELRQQMRERALALAAAHQ